MKNLKWLIAGIICSFCIVMLIQYKKTMPNKETGTSASNDIVANLSQIPGDKEPPTPVTEKEEKMVIENNVDRYKKQLAVKPHDTAVLGMLALNFNTIKQYDDALRAIEKALAIKKDDFWLYRVKGDILTAADKRGAVDAYQKSLSLCDDKRIHEVEKGYIYFGLARYYSGHGDKKKAIANAQKAHDLNRNDKYITDYLNNLKSKTN